MTFFDPTPPRPLSAAPDEANPIVTLGGGGGSDRRWEWRTGLWPLPPPGPLTFALEWEDEGIAETTAALDAASLVKAAGHAVELWPDERPEPPDEQGHGPSPVAYGTWSPESGT